MKCKIKIAPLCVVLTFCLPSLARATANDQPTVYTTEVRGAIPSKDATIVKYEVDGTDRDAYVSAGNLTIEYSDGTKVVEGLPPARKSTANETVLNEVGFDDVKISDDKRTIGWSELFENVGTSYPIPETLAVYRSGKTITHIRQGQMLWGWTFFDHARRVAGVWGPTHGTSTGDYQLYDAETGQMLSELIKDTENRSRQTETAAWVRHTDQELFSRDGKKKQWRSQCVAHKISVISAKHPLFARRDNRNQMPRSTTGTSRTSAAKPGRLSAVTLGKRLEQHRHFG